MIRFDWRIRSHWLSPAALSLPFFSCSCLAGLLTKMPSALTVPVSYWLERQKGLTTRSLVLSKCFIQMISYLCGRNFLGWDASLLHESCCLPCPMNRTIALGLAEEHLASSNAINLVAGVQKCLCALITPELHILPAAWSCKPRPGFSHAGENDAYPWCTFRRRHTWYEGCSQISHCATKKEDCDASVDLGRKICGQPSYVWVFPVVLWFHPEPQKQSSTNPREGFHTSCAQQTDENFAGNCGHAVDSSGLSPVART